MTVKLSNLNHRGILPKGKLVISKTMKAQNLALVFVPKQATNLGTCIYRVQSRFIVGVLKLNSGILNHNQKQANHSGKDTTKEL